MKTKLSKQAQEILVKTGQISEEKILKSFIVVFTFSVDMTKYMQQKYPDIKSHKKK